MEKEAPGHQDIWGGKRTYHESGKLEGALKGPAWKNKGPIAKRGTLGTGRGGVRGGSTSPSRLCKGGWGKMP